MKLFPCLVTNHIRVSSKTGNRLGGSSPIYAEAQNVSSLTIIELIKKILAFTDPEILLPSIEHHTIVSSLRHCIEFTFSYHTTPREGCKNTVQSNCFGFSVWNLLHINLPATI